MNQMNLVLILTFYSSKMYINIILPFNLSSPCFSTKIDYALISAAYDIVSKPPQ
jgi:hypothetical protein